MDYIQVENDQIKGYPQPLPQNWANVSNFYLLEDENLRQFGWYPVRFIPAQKTDNDIVTGHSFVIEGNEVVQYEQIRPKTQEEIQRETDGMWIGIRARRNILLSETDWTQLPDSSISNEKKIQYSVYRQQLRDVTNQPDPKNIVWPTKPV